MKQATIRIVGCSCDVICCGHKDLPEGVGKVCGTANNAYLAIHICNEYPLDCQRDTFFHELCHLVAGIVGLDTIDDRGKDLNSFAGFARLMYGTLVDNDLLDITKVDKLLGKVKDETH